MLENVREILNYFEKCLRNFAIDFYKIDVVNFKILIDVISHTNLVDYFWILFNFSL